MASPTRRRRGPQSPTTMIVNFFLDSPLAVAQGALELASALIARRVSTESAKVNVPAIIRRAFTPEPVSSPSPAQAALAEEAAPAALAPPPPTLRQRRQRSDAGQARGKRAAIAAPRGNTVQITPTPSTRRQRPSVTTAMPAVAAPATPATPAPPAIPLPELPPQDVPYDARDVDPLEVA